MAEPNKDKKPDIIPLANPKWFEGKDVKREGVMVGTTKNPANDLETFEIYGIVPRNDEEAQKRYGCSMHDLAICGVRQLSYRPNYKEHVLNPDGTLKPRAHELAQELFDNYVVGRRPSAVSTGQKAKATAFDSIAGKYQIDTTGKSVQEIADEIEAKILKLKRK